MSIRVLALVPYPIFPAQMGGQKGIALFYKYVHRVLPLAMLSTQANAASDAEYPVYPLIHNGASRYIDPRVFLLVQKQAKQHQATHLLFEHPYYAWLIVLCAFFTKYKIIVHAHNIEATRFKSMGKPWWFLLWVYEAVAFRAAHQVWFKTQTDANYAIAHFKLNKTRAHVIPYGIEVNQLPTSASIQLAKQQLQSELGIDTNKTMLFFNGTLNYGPNLDALNHILNHILPRLQAAQFQYEFIVCGKGLPESMNELRAYAKQHVHYAGFVNDINIYFKACDVFLNPLIDGGGIKTKLVEALGFGKCAVSTNNGAIGVDPAVTGGRLRIVPDNNWDAFATAVMDSTKQLPNNTNNDFYNTFYWGHIAEHAKQYLQQ
jgi:glycosyltransferase involved in cell wall biosynthesis